MSVHVNQVFIENIAPNFEKPSTKDMRNKRIPIKHLTAQSRQQRKVYDTFKFNNKGSRTTSLTFISLTSQFANLIKHAMKWYSR